MKRLIVGLATTVLLWGGIAGVVAAATARSVKPGLTVAVGGRILKVIAGRN